MSTVSAENIRNSRPLQALMTWGHVMFCVSTADHYLHRMETLKADYTLEGIMEIDGLILAFSVTYGRLFTTGARGLPQLDPNRVYKDEELRQIHDRIMDLRHKRYAHEEASQGIDFSMIVGFEEGTLVAKPEVGFTIRGDEFPGYRRLMNALQAFTYDRIHRFMAKATEELGVEVVFPSGPPPAHHVQT